MARTALSHHTSHSTIRSPRAAKREVVEMAAMWEGRVAAGRGGGEGGGGEAVVRVVLGVQAAAVRRWRKRR